MSWTALAFLLALGYAAFIFGVWYVAMGWINGEGRRW